METAAWTMAGGAGFPPGDMRLKWAHTCYRLSADSCSLLVYPSARGVWAAQRAELPKWAHGVSSKKPHRRGMRKNHPVLENMRDFPSKTHSTQPCR